jgi:hypothetical protein
MSIGFGRRTCQVAMGIVGDTGHSPGSGVDRPGVRYAKIRAMQARVSVAEDISAYPDVVYDLISDLPRMGGWSPESTGGRWLGGDGPSVGARFLGRNRSAGADGRPS